VISISLETPDWIVAHISGHPSGGWFHPFRLTPDHPALLLVCEDCGVRFVEGDVAFVMPYHGADKSRWICQHRGCTARQIFGPDAESVMAEIRLRGMLPRPVTEWTLRLTLPDLARKLYVDSAGRGLVQRPSGEWTIRLPSVSDRLELGTRDLDEAKRRADWTSEQWEEHRARRDEARRVVVIVHATTLQICDVHVADDEASALGYAAGTSRYESLVCLVEGDPNHVMADWTAPYASNGQKNAVAEALLRIAAERWQFSPAPVPERR